MVWLRSLLFQIAFWSWTVGLATLAWPLTFGPRRWSVGTIRLWGRVVLALLRRINRLDYRVRGAEHLPHGPCIVAAKHQSAWDTVVYPVLFDDPAMVMKRELMAIPVYGAMARKAGMIPVDREAGSTALRTMLQAARAAAQAGRAIVIFPQGTRVAPGAAAPYLSGVAGLYRALRLPVVPAAVNSGLYWPRRAFVRRPGRITLEFLPLIPPGLDRAQFQRELEAKIEGASTALAAEKPAASACG